MEFSSRKLSPAARATDNVAASPFPPRFSFSVFTDFILYIIFFLIFSFGQERTVVPTEVHRSRKTSRIVSLPVSLPVSIARTFALSSKLLSVEM